MSQMTIETAKPANTNGGAFKVANTFAGGMRDELSRQWMSRPSDQRFVSLSTMREAAQSAYDASRNHVKDTREIEFFAPELKTAADMHKLRVGIHGGGTETDDFGISHWAFNQVCGLSKPTSPARYLRELPSPLAADCLNWDLKRKRVIENVGIYAQTGGDNALVRAFTGPDYGRIPDHEVIGAIQNIAGEGIGDKRWKVPGVMDWSTAIYDPNVPVTEDTTTLFWSDRNMFVFLVDDRNPIVVGQVTDPRTGKTTDDIMFRGFYVTNSEVGAAALRVCAFYLRAVCANRCLWGVENFEEVTIRHTKMAPDRFMETVRPALESFADKSDRSLIEGVEKAKAAKLVANEEEGLAFLRKRQFSGNQAQRILDMHETEEGKPARSAWDMAQGITAFARGQRNTDARIGIELKAKDILDKAAA